MNFLVADKKEIPAVSLVVFDVGVPGISTTDVLDGSFATESSRLTVCLFAHFDAVLRIVGSHPLLP